MMIIKVRNYFFIITFLLINLVSSQENKLFWDGNDWNTIAKNLNHNQKLIFSVKKAYLTGVLDGRLYGYLKTWNKNKWPLRLFNGWGVLSSGHENLEFSEKWGWEQSEVGISK